MFKGVVRRTPKFSLLPPRSQIRLENDHFGSQFSFRVKVVMITMLAVFTLFSLRLLDVQLVFGAHFREIAEANRFFTKPVSAMRGVIFDRQGRQLVFNSPVYFWLDEPRKLYGERVVLEREKALQQLLLHPQQVLIDQYRLYAAGEAMGSILGYTGTVTADDLLNRPELRFQSSTGKMGVERFFDATLQGENGKETYELNAQGQIQRLITSEPAQVGENVQLSIDSQLQEFVYGLMKEKTGAVVVGDPNTGEVLALVTAPTLDSNVFTQPTFSPEQEQLKQASIAAMLQDERKLLFNRAVAGAYPPGSVFKPITAIAALEEEKVDGETVVVDQGELKVDEFVFGNWYYRQYGRTEGAISLARAIARSNDIYFYKAAEWIGPTKLAEYARMFGLGEKTGIELSSEARGLVPDPAWKERVIGERWYLGNTYHMGIGQGDVLVSPVQMFQAMTVFANHGRLCPATLQLGKLGNCKELSISDASLELVKSGMIAACSAGGTAYPFFEWSDRHHTKIACKTGTAEFGAANKEGHRRTHGWFTAIVDLSHKTDLENIAQDEQQIDSVEKTSYPSSIIITVLVESDNQQPYREGSRDAAPIALDIVQWLERR